MSVNPSRREFELAVLGAGPIGLAVKKGNAQLLDSINKSQSKLVADGTLKAIYAKYGFEWTQPK